MPVDFKKKGLLFHKSAISSRCKGLYLHPCGFFGLHSFPYFMQRKLRALLPALALLIGASSCSEDFDVLAPARPFTVVYGILDPSEPVNYVRIQRAYADPNKSALDLAQLPDSSYFPNIKVTFEEKTGTGYRTIVDDLQREKVTDKNAGVFFSTPNYAYKIDQPLTPGSTYRLLIKNNDNGNVDTAETVIVDVGNTKISELDPTINPNQKIELTPTSNTNAQQDGSYSWRVLQFPPSATVRFMNAMVRFHFREQAIGGGNPVDKTVDYIFSRPVNTGINWDIRFPSDKFNNFYVAIANGLGSAPAGRERLVMDNADLIAYFGTPELYDYQQNQVAIGGLGGDQIQYRYTNIRGKNVIGILASRNKLQRLHVPLTNATIEELKVNPNTRSCNITGVTP